MVTYLWLALGLAALGFFAYRAGRVWIDAGQRGFGPGRRLGWALLGAVATARYWWGARIEALSPGEAADFLARETEALGLSHADGLRCPLCGAEIPHAWALGPDGRPTIAPGPVECPDCDFRLDTCRHCVHFLPGGGGTAGQLGGGGGDVTFGRCGQYRRSQPVEQACTPEVARRLRARGWDRIRQVRDPQKRLELRAQLVFPVLDEFCTILRLCKEVLDDPDPKLKRLGEETWLSIRKPLEQDIERGIREGLFQEVDPVVASTFLVGIMEGLHSLQTVDRQPPSSRTWDQALRLILTGMKGTSTTQKTED